MGGEEWRAFWRAPELLGDYPTNTSGDSAQTLWELSQRIKRFLEGNWSAADEDLEPLLARLRIDAGGQLLSAATLQRQGLAQANQILITASEAGKYCSECASLRQALFQRRLSQNISRVMSRLVVGGVTAAL